VKSIERVGKLSSAEFARCFAATETPVILTRLIDDWPARQRWSAEYFQDRFGDVEIAVEVVDGGRAADNQHFLRTKTTRSMPLRQYIDLATRRDDGVLYAAEQPLRRLFPEAAHDLRAVPYLSRVLCRLSGNSELLWIGSRGNASGLHFDELHNFNVQVVGRKRWVIFPKAQQPLLYVPSTLRRSHFSPIDYEQPDYERFPRYRQATPIEFDVQPGETLFLPGGWVHHVRTLEFSINVNLWWLTRRQAVAHAVAALRRSLGRLAHLLPSRAPAKI
jgi:hypothetical protein